jgi:CO/xanthine dehydrogenase Mo-binding subunit
VRHVDEPAALVVADSRYIAEEAVALIKVEYEPLPAVSDMMDAISSHQRCLWQVMGLHGLAVTLPAGTRFEIRHFLSRPPSNGPKHCQSWPSVSGECHAMKLVRHFKNSAAN